jgi:hypothetical protein
VARSAGAIQLMHNAALLLTFVALFGILVTGCDKQEVGPDSTSISAESLFNAISRVEPWRSTKDYTSNDWKNAIEAARMFQNATPSTVELVLQRFAETEPGAIKDDFIEMSKLLLILRIAFDLPESATNNPSASAMTWESGRSEINADGSFNVAWPIRWNNGRPILIKRYSGLSGPAYTVLGDYHIFRSRYPFRKLPEKGSTKSP